MKKNAIYQCAEGFNFLPVSIDAIEAIVLPRLPQESKVWAVGLTAAGKMAFISASTPRTGFITGFVAPECASPNAFASALLAAYRMLVDDDCARAAGADDDDAGEDDTDDGTEPDQPRRYHA